jgi:hypothetical protein
MGYADKRLKKEADGYPVPQGFEVDVDDFVPMTMVDLGNGKYGLVLAGYDPLNNMLKVNSMQKKWRDSFVGAALDASKWDVVVQGAGQTVTVTGGTLQINAGTTVNAETIIRSKEVFNNTFGVAVGHLLSQRIANNDLCIELVSCDADGNVDGLHKVAWRYDGTTATQAKYVVQGYGATELVSSAATVPTTASLNVAEIEVFPNEVYFHGKAIDSTAGRANSYKRDQQIPDPNSFFKIQLHVKNGAVAPASATVWTLQFVVALDYAELTAEITSGRGNAVAGQGIYATVGGTVTASNTSGVSLHDSAVSGAPLRQGLRAMTADFTSVASGDTVDAIATVKGVQIVRLNAIPENMLCAALTLTTAADIQLFAAAGAGLKNNITDLQLQNTSATATMFYLKDGATTRWQCNLPANMDKPVVVQFQTPCMSTANTITNVACGTAGANVLVNAQGYKAP